MGALSSPTISRVPLRQAFPVANHVSDDVLARDDSLAPESDQTMVIGVAGSTKNSGRLTELSAA